MRLTDLEGLSQHQAGDKMNISQSTISRHLDSAHHKVAKALVLGFAIQISNPTEFFHCDQCGHTWQTPDDIPEGDCCDKCGSIEFHFHGLLKSD